MKVTNLSCDVLFNKDDDLSRRFLARKLLKKKKNLKVLKLIIQNTLVGYRVNFQALIMFCNLGNSM